MRATDTGTFRVIRLNESSTINEGACTMHPHDMVCAVTGYLSRGIVTDHDLIIHFSAKDIGEEKL